MQITDSGMVAVQVVVGVCLLVVLIGARRIVDPTSVEQVLDHLVTIGLLLAVHLAATIAFGPVAAAAYMVVLALVSINWAKMGRRTDPGVVGNARVPEQAPPAPVDRETVPAAPGGLTPAERDAWDDLTGRLGE